VPPERLREVLGAPAFVYEAAGASDTAFEVLRVLAPNGVFVFTGVPGRKQRLELEGGTLMKQLVLWNQVVLGTVNAGAEAFEAAVRDLRQATERSLSSVEGLITHRHPLERGPAVLCGEVEGGIKHVLKL
jgi:glucose 1-dehydrogenase